MSPKPIPSLKRSPVPASVAAAFVSSSNEPPLSLVAPPAASIEPALAVATQPAVAISPEAAPAVPAAAFEPEKKRGPAKKSARKLEVRKDGSELRKVTVYLEPDLDRALAIHAASEGIDRSAIVNDAISRYLRKRAE